ncbi:MAG: T9SS type A sorting domain-containing protein [Flavobacteriales bacterium]|jgi:hypothetical protein|tara:strand:+ start:10486 stop:11145 length:660 start_codon:yes stop_codon:yes gene_type:complete
MKTKLLFIALLASTFINAQSIEFTSAELTTAEIGSTITVNYKYTIAADGYIYSAIELLDDWTWSANVASAELTTAVAGTDVTGSFDLTIPNGTTPTADLTGNLNYKIKIELKQNPTDWLAGVYPATQIDLTASTASVNGVERFLSDVKIYPNPARNFFQITNFSKLNNPSVKVYNMLGNELYSTSNGSSTIDISNFTNGVYLLKINCDGLSKTIQFVKF